MHRGEEIRRAAALVGLILLAGATLAAAQADDEAGGVGREETPAPPPATAEWGAGASAGDLPDELRALLVARAGVYRDRARRFECLETAYREKPRDDGTVKEKIKQRRYLLERAEGGEVYRALRGKPEGSGLSEGRPFAVPEPFAWTQLFEETLGSSFHFSVGEPVALEELDGRTAIPVRFEADAPVEEGRRIKEWSGTAWVDPVAGDLLVVIARPNFQDATLKEDTARWHRSIRFRWEALVFKARPQPSGREVRVDFRELHEGLLYPSRAALREFRLAPGDRAVPFRRTLIEYRQYRFFRTDAEDDLAETEALPE